jgi:hypothetical protein
MTFVGPVAEPGELSKSCMTPKGKPMSELVKAYRCDFCDRIVAELRDDKILIDQLWATPTYGMPKTGQPTVGAS